ncbi:putative ABC transport system permease protein [Antricoccus suffuscus]|uniref:Putative ABC transport system permease protein n=1 Tax=Antricoccus suffuscus TaxID=1629062 RepID=A0A2T1A6X8_9ACTN|nr:ABC transporter permease [Antricoccus suffuscus]PRZ44227.1 putative ABC transport system permease protein [Antricoccus suffuscus]
MRTLAFETLRARKGSFIAAFVTLICAAALVAACGSLLESGIRGAVSTERYTATPVVVAADQLLKVSEISGDKTKIKTKALTQHEWIDASLLDQIQGLPGGQDAVGELTFGASVLRPDGTPIPTSRYGESLGHGWGSAGLAPFTLAEGSPPKLPGEVVVDARIAYIAGLHVGDAVNIQTAAGATPYVVSGITKQQLSHQTTIFFADSEASALAAHPGLLYAIGLPGATHSDLTAIQAAAGKAGAEAFTGDRRGAVEFPGVARSSTTLISLGAVLGGISLLIAILVVSGTLALSIGQRERELALLRALGATPKQVRKMIGAEVLLLGIVASLIGAGVGIPLSRLLGDGFAHFGVIPPNLRIDVGLIPIGIAVVATVMAAWTAARVSARRTTAIRPTEALADAAVGPRRLGVVRIVLGVVAAGVGAGFIFLTAHLHSDAGASPVSFLSVIAAAVAIALLGPTLMRGASIVLGVGLSVLSRRSGFLAAANNRTNARRLASIVTPMALGVAMACTILFPPTALQDATAAQRVAATRADSVIVAPGPGVTATQAAAARSVSGVHAVTQETHGKVWFGREKYDATGLTLDGLRDNIDLGVISGSANLNDNQLALSRATANDLGLRVGEPVDLRLSDGTPISLVVGAIYRNDLAFPGVVLSFDLLAAHGDSAYSSSLKISGASTAQLRNAVAGVQVMSADQFRAAQHSSGEGVSKGMGYMILALIGGFTSIAVFNTLAMATAARSREFALLRLAGMKRRGVIRMLHLEVGAATLVAVVLGTTIGLATVNAYAHGVTNGPASITWWMYGVIVAAAGALTWAASSLAARSALRPAPADVISARE